MGPTVTIVGGGLVGLSNAALFAKAGWTVTVYEQARALREIGAAIGVKPGAAVVLDRLGLLEQLSPAVALTMEQRRDGNGAILQKRHLSGNDRFYNPLRQELLDVLSTAAQLHGARIVTGARVVRAEPNGTIHFSDGDRDVADLVVGADGFHSAVRETLGLTRVKRSLPSGATRVIFPRSTEQDMRLEYWSGRLRIGMAPTSGDLTYAYLSAPESDQRGRRVPIDVDYWSGGFPCIDREVFVRMNAAGGVRHQYSYVRCSSWISGKVALIGDAAHALPATLGIGASMGIVNGYYLAEAVGDHGVGEGLKRWDDSRRGISERTQRLALLYDLTTRRTPATLLPIRDRFMKVLDKSAINRKLLGLNAISVPAIPHDRA